MLPDSSVKGRGIARIGSDILEFQTALAISNNDLDRMKGIDFEIAMRNKEWGTMCAAMLPYIPDKPRLSELEAMYISQDVKELPIGYIKESARILTLNTDMLHRFVIGGRIKSGKTIDISELYDCIKERKGCYLILGDIKHLIPINEISHKAGDLAIITAMKRMENAAGEEDIVFRIGGDEFVILTNSDDENYAKTVCEDILSHNQECIEWNNQKISLSMYVKAVRFDTNGGIRYSEFFTMLHNELSEDFKRQVENI